MTLKSSTGLRNHLLDTGSAREALAGGFVHIYAGAEPATADAAIGGATLLCTIYSDGAAGGLHLATEATDGMLQKAGAESWTGTVLATGQATFFRHVGAADTGMASITEPRLQGKVAVSGGELNISNPALVQGAPQAVNFYSLAIPTF